MAQVNVLVSRGSVLLLCLSSSTLFCPSTDSGRDPSPYRELASHRENLIERETGSLCEHGPTHRTGLRPAEPTRVLVSSRPWHPTTSQLGQDSNVLAAHHSAMSRVVLAGSYRTSRARQIKFTRGIPLPFSFDLSVRFHVRF